MSKYYKAEDVINTLADQWRFEQEMESPYPTEDIEEWKKVARELFADLPTIEVSEDCISRERTIERIKRNFYGGNQWVVDEVEMLLLNAPSVVTKRADGEEE